MSKHKRDPEVELFKRKVIDGILTGILTVIAVVVVLIAGYITFQMIQNILEVLSTPQAQILRDVLGFFAGLVGAFAFMYTVARYGIWNDERIEELKKIVESEDNSSE